MHSALLSFRCSKDPDIESFLHTKAIDFHTRKLCSVYLLLNEDLFDQDILKVEAYFTLSYKSLVADASVMSRSSIKKYGGRSNALTLNFVLIGQLGKWMFEDERGVLQRSSVSSCDILDAAFEIIQASTELIPCKHVLVECNDEPKVKAAYENYGFSFFQNDGLHNQYCKRI